jgi:hypothetical protein
MKSIRHITKAGETDSYLQCAVLTKVVLAFRDNRIHKRLPANEAGEGQGLIIVVVVLIRCLIITPIPTSHRNAPLAGLFGLLPLLLELPTGLVIPSVVHEFAGITVPAVARLLVVLADVGLVVEPRGEADVRGGPERAVRAAGLFAGHRVLPAEPGLVVRVAVDPLVDLPGGGGGGGPGGVLLEGLLGLLELALADGARVAVELRLRLERGGGAAVRGLDRPGRLVLEPPRLGGGVGGGEDELAHGGRTLLRPQGREGAAAVVLVVGACGRGGALPDVLGWFPHEAAQRRRASAGPWIAGAATAAAVGHRCGRVWGLLGLDRSGTRRESEIWASLRL